MLFFACVSVIRLRYLEPLGVLSYDVSPPGKNSEFPRSVILKACPENPASQAAQWGLELGAGIFRLHCKNEAIPSQITHRGIVRIWLEIEHNAI